MELYTALTGDPDGSGNILSLADNSIIFDGGVYSTTLSIDSPTANRTVNLPDGDGTLITTDSEVTLSNKTLDGVIINGMSIQAGAYSCSIESSTISGNRVLTIPTITSNDEFVFANNTQTLTNKTFSSPVLNTPKIVDTISDENNSDMIGLLPTSSAVNNIQVSNASINNSPSISAVGNDADISLLLRSKGDGGVSVDKLSFAFNQMTTDGSVDTQYTCHTCDKSTPLSMSLNDGVTIGEMQIFTARAAGTVTITPINFANGSSISIPQYGTVTLLWNGFDWVVVSHYNATINS